MQKRTALIETGTVCPRQKSKNANISVMIKTNGKDMSGNPKPGPQLGKQNLGSPRQPKVQTLFERKLKKTLQIIPNIFLCV